MKHVTTAIFDLDGTIYHDDKLIDGAKELISFLHNIDINVLFLTNNSSKTSFEICSKLVNLGISCKPADVYSSGTVATAIAQEQGLKDIYIFGSQSLKNEFLSRNLPLALPGNAHTLIIGFNPQFTYDDLADAITAGQNATCIIACNKERTFPGKNGRIYPGCGAQVSAIEHCLNRKVDLIIGKPEPLIIKIISQERSLKAEEIIMIGDSYESDIRMAQAFGCKSILVSKTPQQFTHHTSVSNLNKIIELFERNIYEKN